MKLKYIVLTIAMTLLNQQIVTSQNVKNKVDSLLTEKYPTDEPGAVFIITKGEEVIFKKAYGLSNLELTVPMKTDNVFEIGSITKQFTAIAILLLEEQGKLGLQDEITKYIPDYPTAGHQITIHHLLTHTSGIKNFTSVKGLNTIAAKNLKPLEVIDFFKNEPMDFEPGSKFKYSNSGYVILGYIIEKVSGQTYEEFINTNIFKRLKMNASQYANHNRIIPKRAYGYHKKKTFINRRHISFSIPYASGSLMSTVDDMHKWNKAVMNNTLISKETYEKTFTNYTLNNGEHINYGYGWHIKSIDDERSFEHGGHIFGYKSMGVYLPDLDIYVLGLNNCDCNSPTKITKDIAKLILRGTKNGTE